MVKVSDKIRIIYMDKEPQYEGKVGVVEFIDDAKQIHGTWGGCALIPEVDIYEVLHTCAICGKDYVGPGNNAEPLASGRCCDDCNRKVIAERIRRAMQ